LDIKPIAWFDASWYRKTYTVTAEESCLAHYLAHRAALDVSPNPLFSARFYLDAYPDVASASVDPFEHYLSAGRAERRLPNAETDIIRASKLLEQNYYLVNAADVLEAMVDPVHHYCGTGWREGRRPNPYFDPAWYARMYPMPPGGMTPLTDYILHGEAAGYRPCLHFDTEWYRKIHRLSADQSPLAHYLAHRNSQRVSPVPLFDVEFYVQTYAKLIRPGRDAFLHYLVVGAPMDLSPAPWFNAAIYRERHSEELAASGPKGHHGNPLLHLLMEFFGAGR
jgi:hypothetical protein